MKRRLNILCVIVIFVLAYSVLEAAYFMGMGFTAGIKAGFREIDAKEKKEMMNIQVISVIPHFGDNLLVDSVYNQKSGEYVPAFYGQLVVSVDTHPRISTKIISFLATMVHMIAAIWAIVVFLRLVISINKSDIFNWKNVHRLRRMGWMLFICFICVTITALINAFNVEKVFSLRGYSLNISDMLDITSLVLGISALIVAEVFSIGLKMKEDQDLTI